MFSWRQDDPKWGNMGIGNVMRHAGCLVTSLAMIKGITPDNVVNILNADDSCLYGPGVVCKAAAKALGFTTYEKLPHRTPGQVETSETLKLKIDECLQGITFDIIAETNDNADKGAIQHFFVLHPNGEITDPLTGVRGENKYNIVSLRIFR